MTVISNCLFLQGGCIYRFVADFTKSVLVGFKNR
jgi:hypothetical protein